MKTQYIKPGIGIIVSCSPQHLCAGSIHRMHHGNAKGWEPVGDDVWNNTANNAWNDPWGEQDDNGSNGHNSLPKTVNLWDD